MGNQQNEVAVAWRSARATQNATCFYDAALFIDFESKIIPKMQSMIILAMEATKGRVLPSALVILSLTFHPTSTQNFPSRDHLSYEVLKGHSSLLWRGTWGCLVVRATSNLASFFGSHVDIFGNELGTFLGKQLLHYFFEYRLSINRIFSTDENRWHRSASIWGTC